MIISRNFWKDELKKMESNSFDYIVLENPYSFDKDVKMLGYGITLSNLCNTLRLYNDFCEEMKFKQKIDFSVLSKVLIAIYQNKPFTSEELEEFYNFNKELEKLGKAMNTFSTDLAEHVYTDTDVEMMLLGFGWDKQKRLKTLNDNRWGFLDEEFFNLKWEVIEGKRTVENLKKEALHLLETALEEEEKAKQGATETMESA